MNIGFEIVGKHPMAVSMERLRGFYWILKQIRREKGREDRIPLELFDWDGAYSR